ncbi:MAG TPA: phosphonate ABC transporter substrate-binding protein [Burkholderiales bacterium]|nr:phosphonate ABC transporter substrate-binding protein [Burkholderiales bacterium]
MLKRLFAGLTLAALVAAPAAMAQERPKELNFGIISTESTQNLRQDWAVLLEDMQKRLGMKVNAFFAPDYAGIIEGMRFNKVQVAWFGNKSGMEAVDRASGEVIAQQISEEGHPGYWSLLIVHKDSPLNSLEDVKRNAKSLALGFGDPNSTSGFLVPSYYVMALNNLDPKSSFKVMRQANHETNLVAVVNRQVDVATNNTETFEKFTRRNPEEAKKVRVIWKSPLIPNDPMVVRKDLDPGLKAEIREFFVSYGKDEREKQALHKIHIGGFQASDNNQLLPIRQLELFKTKIAVEKDERMAAAEKQAKLADIERQLASLNQQMAALKK